MKVKDIYFNTKSSMPLEVFVDGMGFIQLWMYETLLEESRINEIIKEEKDQESKLNWELIQSNLIATINKIWED